MKRKTIITVTLSFLAGVLIILAAGCKKRDTQDLQPPSFPQLADVFIDDFTGDLAYAAFGGSDVTAFKIETKETYNGSKQSMRFEVPDANSPNGSYAGGVYYSKTGRDLSGYNALTFYIKATQPATIGVIGLGNDLSSSKYQVTLNNLAVNSNWKKVIIPIPDPSKLIQEKGLLYYSAGPENGKGYTFWIDEVKFEKLGTLANPTAIIMNGADKEQISYVGVNSTIDGFGASYNLPNGIDQLFSISPYYFNFISSNPGVATVNTTGIVTTVGGGTAKITAKLDTATAKGSLTINSGGNFTGAPVPALDAAEVISIFTDKYTNVPVDYYNGYWQPYQTTLSADFSVNGDRVLNYTNFNFVGTQISSPSINVSSKAFLHLDIFIPGTLNNGAVFKVKLVDFGANAAPGGGDDVSDEVSFTAPALKANSWVSLDIPFSSLPLLTTKAHIGQIIYEGANIPNFFADNIYFWSYPSTPLASAPVPTKPATDVKSVFSDTYTNIPGTDFNPNWGQATIVSQVPIAGNNTLKYAGLNYQGVQLGSAQDVSGYASLHLDYYSTNSTSLNIYLISPGPVEKPFTLTVPTSGGNGWKSIDIPLSAFAPVNLANIIQFKFDGNGDIFLDNIYFYKNPGPPATPVVAAPAPTTPAANVISVFSDAYTNVAGSDLNPNWGQATVVSQLPIAGNNTLKYAGLNYQGLQLGSNQNVSSYGFLHLDFYSANSTSLKIYLISPGPVETPFTLTVPTNGNWTSINIPLTAFAPVNLSDVIQFKFDGNGDIFLDNIYFYKSAPPPITPTVAAPAPTTPAANVISIFSDAYTNVAGSDLNPNWGQATVVSQLPIAGNNTLKYAGLNYQGLQIGSSQNVSSYGFLHLDFYSANSSSLNIYLISPGPVEKPYTLTVPTNGSWTSINIPLTAFAPVNLSDVIQFKFDGNGDIFLDNIYFYKTGGGGSCPTPPAGEFIVDGGFEANAGCWELIVNQAGTSATIVNNVSNGGTNSAKIKTGPAGNPGIKQTRFGVGTVLPNTTYVVTFDVRADAADPVANGAVLKAAAFSEASEASGNPATRHELIAGEGNVSTSWTTKTLTFTTPANAANVAGGLSLLIELIGGGPTTTGTIYIDNVSLKKQ